MEEKKRKRKKKFFLMEALILAISNYPVLYNTDLKILTDDVMSCSRLYLQRRPTKIRMLKA